MGVVCVGGLLCNLGWGVPWSPEMCNDDFDGCYQPISTFSGPAVGSLRKACAGTGEIQDMHWPAGLGWS